MTTIRRFAYAVFGVACTHLVFGAIVRISGSGMGCGPHWPRCYGRWFPPFDRPDLVIEVLHRYLASVLLLSLIAFVVVAWRRRAEAGVGGPGGVLRMALLATGLGFGAALLGAVTVKFGNSPPATVAHWTMAMSLVAAVTACVVRAGGLGGAAARVGGASDRTRRGTFVAAALALVAVVMGGLTAKVAGGPVACLSFPLCGANPDVARGAVHVQSTHRVIAVLLVLHLVGLFFALRKRNEAPVIRRAASVALALGVLQLLVAGAMIGMRLPPVLRSLHEATGVSIWIATFVLAYLSRIAGGDARDGAVVGDAPRVPSAPTDVAPEVATSGRVVVSTPTTRASAVATPSSPVSPGSLSDEVVAASAVRAPEAPPREAPADGPLELPAAIGHGTRAAKDASLSFHRVSADALVALAAAEVTEVVEPTGPVVAAPSGVMAAALAAMEAGVMVPAEIAEIARGRVAAPVGVVDAPITEAAVPAMRVADLAANHGADRGTDLCAELGADRCADPGAVEHDIVSSLGAPPEVEDSAHVAIGADPIPARSTIFDAAAPASDVEAEDELYNLRDLEAEEDEPDDAIDPVATLDEEFSLQAMTMDGVVAPANAYPSLASIAARRPGMSHSIAVIVARGADF